jgi:hypothetical protein
MTKLEQEYQECLAAQITNKHADQFKGLAQVLAETDHPQDEEVKG